MSHLISFSSKGHYRKIGIPRLSNHTTNENNNKFWPGESVLCFLQSFLKWEYYVQQNEKGKPTKLTLLLTIHLWDQSKAGENSVTQLKWGGNPETPSSRPLPQHIHWQQKLGKTFMVKEKWWQMYQVQQYETYAYILT